MDRELPDWVVPGAYASLISSLNENALALSVFVWSFKIQIISASLRVRMIVCMYVCVYVSSIRGRSHVRYGFFFLFLLPHMQ